MKTLITIALSVALITLPTHRCSAPEIPPQTNVLAVGVVLALAVVAVAGTAIYVVVKCAKKLNRPPTIEGSTNRIHWQTKGQMELVGDEFQFVEPATNSMMFYRANL